MPTRLKHNIVVRRSVNPVELTLVVRYRNLLRVDPRRIAYEHGNLFNTSNIVRAQVIRIRGRCIASRCRSSSPRNHSWKISSKSCR